METYLKKGYSKEWIESNEFDIKLDEYVEKFATTAVTAIQSAHYSAIPQYAIGVCGSK